MRKIFLKIVFLILSFLNSFLKIFGKISFFQHLNDYIVKKNYFETNINNSKTFFFVPSYLSLQRATTIFSKEPDTINWINNFESKNNNEIVFWDIGSNVGIYSIYAAKTHPKIKVYSFEASTSNFRCLSRNISINNLTDKIFLCQIPLTNKENKFLEMKEKIFVEGGASSTFGEEFDFMGNKILNNENRYKLYGTSINYLLKNSIMEVPNYIKIDVDGIEHIILEGANEYLNNKNILGVSVELNKQFEDQFNKCFKILEDNDFKYTTKFLPINSDKKKQNELQVMNYHFDRKNI